MTCNLLSNLIQTQSNTTEIINIPTRARMTVNNGAAGKATLRFISSICSKSTATHNTDDILMLIRNRICRAVLCCLKRDRNQHTPVNHWLFIPVWQISQTVQINQLYMQLRCKNFTAVNYISHIYLKLKYNRTILTNENKDLMMRIS